MNKPQQISVSEMYGIRPTIMIWKMDENGPFTNDLPIIHGDVH